MDMILTGRPVGAEEAHEMGLVNRLVPAGEALAAAQQLARDISTFPLTCLREDRASVLEQDGLDEADAIANEFRRFVQGAGRHGTFASTPEGDTPRTHV